MTHEFVRAKTEYDEDGGFWLCLQVKNPPMARNEVHQLKDGKPYAAEIKRVYNKRSNRANAYFWELCGKLAAMLQMSKTEVYRSYIPEIGENFRMVQTGDEAQKAFITELWNAQGLGWVVEDAGGGWLMCYYGSSTYDTRQMARLINLVSQDCMAQGIQTEPPGSVERWISDWKPEERNI